MLNELVKELKKHGKAICSNTLMLPDGTIKAVRDCTATEKLNAIYFYNFYNNKIYKI